MRAYLVAAAVLARAQHASAQAECPTESSLRTVLAHVQAERAEVCETSSTPDCDRLAARAAELAAKIESCYGGTVDISPHPAEPAFPQAVATMSAPPLEATPTAVFPARVYFEVTLQKQVANSDTAANANLA